jgi:hypothetical protein
MNFQRAFQFACVSTVYRQTQLAFIKDLQSRHQSDKASLVVIDGESYDELKRSAH